MSIMKFAAGMRTGRNIAIAMEDFLEPERLNLSWKAECDQASAKRESIHLVCEGFLTGSDDDFTESSQELS